MSRSLIIRLCLLLAFLTPLAYAQSVEPTTLRAEREAVEARDYARLSALAEDSGALTQALGEARESREEASRRRDELDARRAELEVREAATEARMDAQDESLASLLSTLQHHSGQLRDTLVESWLTVGGASLPPRIDDADVLTLEHIEELADSLMALTVESGRVVALEAPVAGVDGEVSRRRLVRLGDVAAFSEGRLLRPGADDDRLSVAAHTPSAVGEVLSAFQAGKGDSLVLDPTRGTLLAALAQQPTLRERFHQGGAVGYVVVALGALGLLVALVQYANLLWVSLAVRRQRYSLERLCNDNPLGRVLARFHALGDGHSPEALEARLDEAMLAEQPRLERGQALVKLLAALAPLLGLLGTVVGMIVTFQAITVFGTGDPRLMAGGISQALVTTVLGLVTAVPLLFAHTALVSRSRQLIGIVEGQACAALADRLETRPEPLAGRRSHDAALA